MVRKICLMLLFTDAVAYAGQHQISYIYADECVVGVTTPMHPDVKRKMEEKSAEQGISLAELNRQILEEKFYESKS